MSRLLYLHISRNLSANNNVLIKKSIFILAPKLEGIVYKERTFFVCLPFPLPVLYCIHHETNLSLSCKTHYIEVHVYFNKGHIFCKKKITNTTQKLTKRNLNLFLLEKILQRIDFFQFLKSIFFPWEKKILCHYIKDPVKIFR